MKLSEAQRKALARLHKRSGEGVIDRYGHVLAAGEVCGCAPETFLRLMTFGCIDSPDQHRLRITPAGRAALKEADSG